MQEEALNWQAAYKNRPPTEAIVFILGGSTYEESKVGAGNSACTAAPALACRADGDHAAAAVAVAHAQAVYEWNKQGAAKQGQGAPPAMRVLLGGSEVLNSDMFLQAMGTA